MINRKVAFSLTVPVKSGILKLETTRDATRRGEIVAWPAGTMFNLKNDRKFRCRDYFAISVVNLGWSTILSWRGQCCVDFARHAGAVGESVWMPNTVWYLHRHVQCSWTSLPLGAPIFLNSHNGLSRLIADAEDIPVCLRYYRVIQEPQAPRFLPLSCFFFRSLDASSHSANNDKFCWQWAGPCAGVETWRRPYCKQGKLRQSQIFLNC